MCRFALVRSELQEKPEKTLRDFADMAKKSKALDGDWQGDGWGIAWLQDGEWKEYKSLKPVWEDRDSFASFPKTNMFLVHARSASFPKDKGIIAFNQPYIYKQYAFVFNGLLQGVRLSVPGRIGAEKIWYLLKKNLDQDSPVVALQKTAELLRCNSRKINALNVGFSDQNKFYSFCYYTINPEYYNLQYAHLENTEILCSEQIGNHLFQPISVGKVMLL